MTTEANIEATLTEHLSRAVLIENPMWDYLMSEVPHDEMFAFGRTGYTPSPWGRLTDDITAGRKPKRYRDFVTTQWAWAITSPESLAYITTVLDGRPVVEIGAGSGYWAWMLSQLDVDIVAYDKAPLNHKDSWFGDARVSLMEERRGSLGVTPQEYFPVQVGGPEKAAEHSDRVLFMVWPPYGSSMASEAVLAFEGDTIIFIGEGSGGCTADNAFFGLMGGDCGCWDQDDDGNDIHDHDPIEQLFTEASNAEMVQWGGIHDWLTVYRRTDA